MESRQKQIDEAVNRFESKLRRINPAGLAISVYNQKYLEKYIHDFTFYMSLYAQLLLKALNKTDKPVSESTFIDYGGGCGILSFLAKEIGFQTVIYTDIYQVSVNDAQTISGELGIPIDHFWCEDIEGCVDRINKLNIRADLICSMDVLEHIYNLENWFNTLSLIRGNFTLLFMTSANSRNPYVSRRIKRLQTTAEHDGVEKTSGWKERDTSTSFLAVRQNMIRNNFPQLTDTDVDLLASGTRGLREDDIETVVKEYLQTGCINFRINHPTNTCDPYTGNWVEHLIDLKHLKEIIKKNNLAVEITNSKYGYSANKIFNIPKCILNQLIGLLGPRNLFLSHTYTLEVQRL